ncbi:voltage-dependent L-type calcium channel subunit alpha-1C [Trichonephila clavipes]|nr:voltage-dependent L-type calcium channel subunit alpha-1C [Trichonephila clavipes]
MKVADVETTLQRNPLERPSVYINIITGFISLLKVIKGTLGCRKTAQHVTHLGTVLDFSVQSGRFSHQLCSFHRQFAAVALLVHHDLRTARHAGLRRKIQLQGTGGKNPGTTSTKIPEGSELANMVANDAKMIAKVAKLAAKNDANLALPPRFRQAIITTWEVERGQFYDLVRFLCQILTGEDWNEVMYDGIRAYGGVSSYGVLACVYFIILFICGNYILLNVFLAIAVDNLADADSLTGVEKEEEEEEGVEEAAPEGGGEGEEKGSQEELDDEMCKRNRRKSEMFKVDGVQMNHVGFATDKTNQVEIRINSDEEKEEEEEGEGEEGMDDEECEEEVESGVGSTGARPRRLSELDAIPNKIIPIPPYSSFFIFSPTNCFRVFCHRVINHSLFGNIVLACILISSAMLAAEDPLSSDTPRNKILNKFDMFFTSVFTVEIAVKAITYGLILHKGSFCRSAFNNLDILVVSVSLISFGFDDEAHFWLNGYVNKQNCRIWSEANQQVYVETPLHPEKLTVWCALWAGGIIGPYYFKNDEGHNVTVNGDRYRAMITNFFIPELNNHDVQEL